MAFQHFTHGSCTLSWLSACLFMYYSQHMAYVLYPGSVPAYLCTTVNTWLMFSIQAQCLLIYVLQSAHGLCSLSRLSACLFMYYSQHMAYVLYPGSVPAYLCTTVNTWLIFSIQAQCLLIYVLQSTHGLCSLSRLSACLFMYYSQHMAYVLYPGSVPAYLCTTVNTWLMFSIQAQCLLIYVLQSTHGLCSLSRLSACLFMYYSQHMAYVLYPGSVPAYLCTTVNTWLIFSIQAQCLLIYVLQSTHGLYSLSRLSACLFMYYSQHMAKTIVRKAAQFITQPLFLFFTKAFSPLTR